jgi:hypothetical protein
MPSAASPRPITPTTRNWMLKPPASRSSRASTMSIAAKMSSGIAGSGA